MTLGGQCIAARQFTFGWRRRSVADWSWQSARLLLAANWAFNAFPGKYRPSWYEHEFSARVGSFARDNPWPPVQAGLTGVVLVHPAPFAGLSAAGETAAAVLLLVPLTTRLGGAISAAVAISYALASGWINVGYALHRGSFALLGILFLAFGASLPAASGPRLRFGLAVLCGAGLILAWPLAFRWIGLLPTLPWSGAALALIALDVRLSRRGRASKRWLAERVLALGNRQRDQCGQELFAWSSGRRRADGGRGHHERRAHRARAALFLAGGLQDGATSSLPPSAGASQTSFQALKKSAPEGPWRRRGA